LPALALVAVGLAVFLAPEPATRPIEWRALSAGPLQIAFQQRRLFRDSGDFDTYLRRTGANRVPRVDFAARQVLLLTTGPRSSTGYGIDVLDATEKDDDITVRVRERAPGLADHVEPVVTYPYRLLSLPAGRDVFVDWVGR
jgi:hypothetical protein